MYIPLLDITDLNKSYPGRNGTHANRDISLSVAPGEITGLLGHNGAGKTTLVNQIVGILKPDSGAISVAGVDVVAHPATARKLVAVQAQSNVPITGLTPAKAVELVGRIRGLSRRDARMRTNQLLDALDLGPWANTPAQKVSGGVARLTAFAMAAVAPEKLIILDEPTNDVDPVRRRLLWQSIRRLADEGAGILLVTHNVIEAETTVDDLVILNQGRVIAQGNPQDLAGEQVGDLTLVIHDSFDVVPGFLHPVRRESRKTVYHVYRDDAGAASEWAVHHCDRFTLSPTSLEDLYINLVGADEQKEHVA